MNQLPHFLRDSNRRFHVFLRVNLGHVGSGVPQRDLGGFDAIQFANLGSVCVSELIWEPMWDYDPRLARFDKSVFDRLPI